MKDDPLKHFMKRGDTGALLRREIEDQGTGLPMDLTGASVKFIMKSEDFSTELINVAASIEDPPSSGVVRYDWQTGDTDTVGIFPSEFQVTKLSGEIVSFPPNRDDPDLSFIFIHIGQDLGD